MRRLYAALGWFGLLTTAACYSYRTIPVEDVRPDLPVRLRVRPEATERVSQVLGYLSQDVDGTVISADRDTLLLAVRSFMPSTASVAQQVYQRLDIPVSQLIEVEQRRLDRTKTYACVGVAAAGVGALAVWALTSSNILGSQSTPPVVNNRIVPAGPGRPTGVRLPLWRLPLGP